MTIIPTAPTPVDVPGETTWGYAHIVRIEFAPIDQRMRRNPLWTINAQARWAIVGRDQFGATHLLGTNGEHVNLLAFARAVADAGGAELVEPEAVCEYDALPVPVGSRYCAGTDCWLLDGRREAAWWAA